MTLKQAIHRLFFPKAQEIKTVWRIRRDKKEGVLVGTAHFFRYRLNASLERYIRQVQNVLFEGPLDEASMNLVRQQGRSAGGGQVIYEALDPHTLKKITNLMAPSINQSSPLLLFNPMGPPVNDPLAEWFKDHRPWLAFFEIWAQFLRNQGWRHSVDKEALAVATRLKRKVHFLETISEQIEAMEGIPVERITRFLKRIDQWKEFSRHHLRYYLEGNIEAMMGLTVDFPTRCPSILDDRDPVFFERMRPFFEKENTMACVGTIHIPGLRQRFQAEGFSVEQVGSRPE